MMFLVVVLALAGLFLAAALMGKGMAERRARRAKRDHCIVKETRYPQFLTAGVIDSDAPDDFQMLCGTLADGTVINRTAFVTSVKTESGLVLDRDSFKLLRGTDGVIRTTLPSTYGHINLERVVLACTVSGSTYELAL